MCSVLKTELQPRGRKLQHLGRGSRAVLRMLNSLMPGLRIHPTPSAYFSVSGRQLFTASDALSETSAPVRVIRVSGFLTSLTLSHRNPLPCVRFFPSR